MSKIDDEDLIEILKMDSRIKPIIDSKGGNGLSKDFLEQLKKVFLSHTLATLPAISMDFQKKLKEILDSFFVLCLSKELENILMWGHYTRGHKGAVIEFVAQNDNFFCASQEVRYQDEIPNLFNNFVELMSFSDGEFSKEKRDKIFKLSALTKSTHWSYEKEWRVLSPFTVSDGKQFVFTPFNAVDVRAVYLGCKIDPNKSHEIIEVLKSDFPSAQAYNSVTSEEKYSLNFIQV